MYQLACSDGYKYQSPETYVLDILPVATGLAATASDQTLSLFDPLRLSQGPIKKIRTDHGNITCAKAYSAADSIICTAGENGTVSVWDLRLDPANARALQIGGELLLGSTYNVEHTNKIEIGNLPGILSLACSNETNTIFAGTELADHQASILIWSVFTPLTPISPLPNQTN
jgi:WD40 repeat protein